MSEERKINIKKSLEFIAVIALLIMGVLGGIYSVSAYPEVFKSDVYFLKTENIGLEEPVVINFSQPVLSLDDNAGVALSPQKKTSARWEDNNQRLVLTPADAWEPGTHYTFSFPGGRSVMLTKIGSAKISFSTLPYPQVSAVTPADGQRSVSLDIEDPITVNFSKPTKDFLFNFVMDPAVELTYISNDDGTQFKLLPKAKLRDGQRYQLQVFAKYVKSQGAFQKIFTSSFETVPPAVWAKDFTLRLDQARRFTVAKIITGKYIDINLEEQVMTTFQDGKLLDAFMISSGKAGMPTPRGQFKIEGKSPRAWSKTYGLFMPYWNAIVPGGKFGIHELPEWPGGYKEGAAHLGTPVSHGCVRLGVGPAKIVFDWAEVGTPVVIY